MSRLITGKIFYYPIGMDAPALYFYEVVRATTNTCDVVTLAKNIVSQTEKYQYVEPDITRRGVRIRCKVLSCERIQMKSGEIAVLWDGKPLQQLIQIYMLGLGAWQN